ncbi:MAG: DNA polymerase I [Candidatus Riflebacteria bacterium]|nr:DNA polymerase I [Candidatus Riflebacteria bacterium]
MSGLLLIDGNNILYRAHYALERMGFKTRDGKPTGALFGFSRMLLKMMREMKPDRVAVAFDMARDTFRKKLYPEYKATRRPTPPELISQMPVARDFVTALGITIMENPVYEADDLIGTVAEMYKSGDEVSIVTGDRDLLQLIDEHVRVYLCAKGITEMRMYDDAAFVAEYGFQPRSIVDLKALWGDSSDNIPGVDGIGEKKGLDLIRRFGTIDALYASLEKVDNTRMREGLAKGRESAVLSHDLATIRRDVPRDLLPKSFSWPGLDAARPRLVDFFRQWGFQSLLSEVAVNDDKGNFTEAQRETGKAAAGVGETPAPALASSSTSISASRGASASAMTPMLPFTSSVEPESITSAVSPDNVSSSSHELPVSEALKPIPGERLIITRLEDLERIISEPCDLFSLDLETDGLDPWKNRIVGFSFACSPERAFYVPLRHAYLGLGPDDQIEPVAAFRCLKEAMRGHTLIGHNLKFDLTFLAREGVTHEGPLYDTLLAAYVIDPTASNGLKALARSELGLEVTDFLQVAPKGNFASVSLDRAVEYAAQDAIIPLLLKPFFDRRLAEHGLTGVLEELETPLLPLLLDMESIGIRLNTRYLYELSAELSRRLAELEISIHGHAGVQFNINSGKQLQEVLFKKLGLTPPRKTKTGFSTDSEVLHELAPANQICRDLLQYRELAKLKSTYADSLAALVAPGTEIIHTSFNQTITATGRLSSSNPNMQNIPIKTDWGRKIRRAFEAPRSGDCLLSIDYSQIELRLLAHFADDPALTEAFNAGLDIHTATAARLFGKTPDAVTGDERKIGKTVNFGIIYGISSHSLSEDLGITRVQAQRYIDGFFEQFPGVTRFFNETVAEAHRTGSVKTLFNRVRPIPELSSGGRQTRSFGERVARNTPLQGSAADLVKKAMLDCDKALKSGGFAARIILQIHDELVFTVPENELSRVVPMLTRVMENTVRLRVPLVCDAAAGPNLADLVDVAHI